MATPDANNLYLGAGELWINRMTHGALGLWRHLGNVTRFELTPSVETLEKQSSMEGARGTLKEVVTKTTMEIGLTLDEFDPENLALALFGSVSAYSQTNGTVTDTSLGTAKKGYWLDTGKQKITVTAIKVGTTTYAEGTDYSVDSESGMIYITPNSTIVDGSTVLWSGSYAAITSTQIQALADAKIECALRFRSASDATGPRFLCDVWRASIQPDGALSMLTEQFGEITLRGKVLADTSKPVGERYYRKIVLPTN